MDSIGVFTLWVERYLLNVHKKAKTACMHFIPAFLF